MAKQLSNPPDYQLNLIYPLRDELNDKQSRELDNRISEATISPEAMLLFQEMLNDEISNIGNIEYDPTRPAIYGQWVYHYKARIAILQQLIQRFQGKVR